MATKKPIKKGIEYLADTATRDGVFGLDAFSVRYLNGPIPEATIDVVKYNTDYLGSQFVSLGSMHAPAWGTIGELFDPNSAEPITQNRYQDDDNKIDLFAFIDRFYFNNGVIIGDYNDAGFAIQGLYEYIGRDVPDVGGFNYWLSGYDERGVSLATLASDFIRIKSEAAKAGSLTADPQANKEFVQYLYRSILERPGDQQGVDFWTSNLDANLASRADVLAEFIQANGETSWYLATSGQTQPFGGWQWIELA